AAVYNFATM
nr:Chain C, PEPTIDE WITH SEQUENCE ALA-ALA-VAL-TYR-ASN-PHE-ALA-THR-MET [synthetic construct]1FFO_F Chain F, PEPTIDE WITH SEQUENCE ALA-ALA-VAL-TYR-ASN-PHE-ALA-THR-MET [synthetic construct]